jgi:Nucleoside-diphosphate-sugar epimerases
MDVFLTGSTGFIGSAVLRRLIDEGHEVTALVRSPEKAALVEAAGAQPLVGDATDDELLGAAARGADGVVHAAAPGDATSPEFDEHVAEIMLGALSGTGKPYLHTSGIWVYGDNGDITEESPTDAPAIAGWRPALHARLRAARGLVPVIIVPAIVHGHGGGVPNLLLPDKQVHLIGDGHQHWPTVHVDDLAALYVLALEGASAGRVEAGSVYIGASGQNPTVRQLGDAAAQAAGIPGGATAETADESRARLGVFLADALLLDQQASGTRARADLGWEPNSPSLLEELAAGYAGS